MSALGAVDVHLRALRDHDDIEAALKTTRSPFDGLEVPPGGEPQS